MEVLVRLRSIDRVELEARRAARAFLGSNGPRAWSRGEGNIAMLVPGYKRTRWLRIADWEDIALLVFGF